VLLLHELLDTVDVLELRGDPRTEIASVTHDSRAVGPGDLFCCVPGATADGHDHAPAAVAAGAAALLVERPLGLPVAEARVASVRAVMGPVAAAAWGHPSTKLAVLGVTGTNGKTTTTWLLEAIARAAGIRPGVIGTIGARIDGEPIAGQRTTPEAPELQALLARMVGAGVGLAAIEVSSHALVMHRVDGTHFAAACFTNLSHEHLDFHAGLDDYFEAKALLFDPARTDAAAANLDDPYGVEIARRAEGAGLSVLGFGLDAPAATVRAEDFEAAPSGNRFRLVTPYGSAAVRSPLVGRFNASNALAAAATALAAGLDVEAVAAGLSAPLVVPGRMERVDAGQPFPVLVDYAHTPDGLEQVLRAARPLTAARGGRVVVVFGCGGDRDRAKRPAMGKAAAGLADVIVVTSDNPRSEEPMAIIEEVVAGIPSGTHATVVPDRRLAVREALAGRAAGDVVIVAGKGHESGQTAGGVTVPFDDRVVAREELARLGWSTASVGAGEAAGPATAAEQAGPADAGDGTAP
jgi:UDP-N-acetylmuramoyl-L-alanyl-D-glutamate--2,6-diaminopimelate ligase